MQVTPNRFQRARDAFVVTPDLFATAFLRDFSLEDLAKTGDAQKQFMVVEYTLESRNEAGSGIIADLTTS